MTNRLAPRARLATALATLGCAAALAACGSGGDGDSGSTASVTTQSPAGGVTSDAPAPATSAPAPAPAKKPGKGKGPPASLPTTGKNVTVPDVVGDTFAEAGRQLDMADLVMTAESTTGDRSKIEAGWEVCQTVPAPGRRTPAGTPVAVIGAPPGEC